MKKIVFIVIFIAFWGLYSCNTKAPFPENAGNFAVELENGFDMIVGARTNNVSDDSLRLLKIHLHRSMTAEYPLCYDWWLQDGQHIDWFDETFDSQLALRVARVTEYLGKNASLVNSVEQYIDLCIERRAKRLDAFVKDNPKIIFTKFRVMNPMYYAQTEAISDNTQDRRVFPDENRLGFYPGSQISTIAMDGIWAREEILLNDSIGSFRDPDVDFDGKRVVFSWKKGIDSDFNLFEIDMKTRKVRQVTDILGHADIEPIYLQNGNILFGSTRVGIIADCWVNEVSHLYVCDREGNYMRRLCIDQVHTLWSSLLDDGRVIYMRWDYSDRSPLHTQPLFQMNPDGTGQSAYYGMSSWFPTNIAHARQIPGTRKIMATIIGHHTPQHGKLGIIDPEAGRDENEGVMLIAPVRKPENVRIDQYGQYGEQFQNPFPLNENEFLVSYCPLGYDGGAPLHPVYAGNPIMFGIYWMDMDGNRELFVSDPKLACNQPRMLAARPMPFNRASSVDYSKTTGVYFLQNVYEGRLMDSLPKGTIKKLRIIEPLFDVSYGVGGATNLMFEPEYAYAYVPTPQGVGNTSWNVKKVYGEVDVYEDGSAMFEVPARVPLYFQALDANGHMVQTMRSWSTLQPGEMQSCVGCHEHKNSVPVANKPVSIAMSKGVQSIVPLDDKGVRGFSFINEIQPILDNHCISCHDGKKNKLNLTGEQIVNRRSGRNFSYAYLNLTHSIPYGATAEQIAEMDLIAKPEHPEVNFIHPMSEPTMLKPYTAGAAKSNLIRRLKNGHGNTVITPHEINTIAMWIDILVPYVGDYEEANNWTQEKLELWQYHKGKRQKTQEEEAIAISEYILSLKN